jgi:hypothetical protein
MFSDIAKTENEMSFRQTIHGLSTSDRGFKVVIDRKEKKVLISFDSTKVSNKHSEWLKQVQMRIGLGELDPQPYWGFDDLSNKAGTKLLNCFYVQAEVKKVGEKELYKYSKVMMLQKFDFEGFLDQIEKLRVQMKTTEKGFEMNDELTEFLEKTPEIEVQVDFG